MSFVGFDESSTSMYPESSVLSGSNNNNSNDAGDFECNICFELAKDPIVTLCGHLFCWPCLYRWLRHHSHSHECPVCKAVIQEGKLVPLYGRGKTQGDPRAKSYPGIDVPRRPSGQRPETATPPPPPPQVGTDSPNFGFGMMGGFVPTTTARVGGFTLSTSFGALSIFPSLFNIQFHGFPDATVYGTTYGFPFGFNTFHGGFAHGFPQGTSRGQQADKVLKNLLMLVGVLVVLALLWW